MLLAKVKAGKAMAADPGYRVLLSSVVRLTGNLCYALYHLLLGVTNRSLWFIFLCAFYAILATARFSAVLCARGYPEPPSGDTGQFVMRGSGVLFLGLSFLLAAANGMHLSQNITLRHDTIPMITIATYTFYKIILSIVKAVKGSFVSSPLICTLRNIGYAEVAASVLTLQRSMLASFGTTSARQVCWMNSITCAAVCLFILILGLSMILHKKREV